MKNNRDLNSSEELLSEIRKVLQIECEAVQEMIDKIDEQAAEAVRLLNACKGRVIVTGMGKTGLIGRKIASTMASTGTPTLYLHPAEAIHGDLGVVTSDDLVLAISNSGETEEIVRLLPHLKQFGVKVISLTGNKESTLAKYSNVVVDCGVSKEADPLGIAPTSSTTAVLAVGDALAGALILLRGFTRDQFAIFHPGGSLGRKLLWQVKDLMHTGEDIPVVKESVSLREAIIIMSEKRLGTVFIVNDAGNLSGIFTDGDLRRLFQEHAEPLAGPITDFMTRNPKRIEPEALAAEAMKMMEDYACMILPVIDESGKPVGAIHMHDLVRSGLAEFTGKSHSDR